MSKKGDKVLEVLKAGPKTTSQINRLLRGSGLGVVNAEDMCRLVKYSLVEGEKSGGRYMWRLKC